MKQKLIGLCALCIMSAPAIAQSWVAQARKAVFSVVTYDKDNNILNTGNGFYITANGTALSDYKLFQEAHHAVVIDSEGKKSDVAFIQGANDMYDIIKFQVRTEQPVHALTIAPANAVTGNAAYILPYSTQKSAVAQKCSVKATSQLAEQYSYYTLSVSVSDKNVSCPLLNDKGQVLGLIQKGSATECYALSARYGEELKINPLSQNDYTLNKVFIPKDLPEKKDEALVNLMMLQSGPQEQYALMLDRFIEKFPEAAEGYLQRAISFIDKQDFAAAEKDLSIYASKNNDKADMHYNLSKLYYQKNLLMPEPAYADWNFDKALREIDEAIATNPLALYIKHKGDILFAQGNYEASYQTFQSLLQTELRNAATFYAMSLCKEKLEAPIEEIIALQDSAVSTYTKPYSAEVVPYLYALAQNKAKAGKYREAVTDMNEVEHIFGGRASAEFYYTREQMELQCKMYQQALDDIEEAAELAPNDADIIAELASMYVRLSNFDKAIPVAQRIIEMQPDSSVGYRILGYCQLRKGEKNEGRKNLEKAKELGDPNAEGILSKYL